MDTSHIHHWRQRAWWAATHGGFETVTEQVVHCCAARRTQERRRELLRVAVRQAEGEDRVQRHPQALGRCRCRRGSVLRVHSNVVARLVRDLLRTCDAVALAMRARQRPATSPCRAIIFYACARCIHALVVSGHFQAPSLCHEGNEHAEGFLGHGGLSLMCGPQTNCTHARPTQARFGCCTESNYMPMTMRIQVCAPESQ